MPVSQFQEVTDWEKEKKKKVCFGCPDPSSHPAQPINRRSSGSGATALVHVLRPATPKLRAAQPTCTCESEANMGLPS